jgi:hypothetical protein
MSNRPRAALAVLVLTPIVAGTAAAGAATTGTLTATLSGKNEPAGGAPAGKGTFSATVKAGKLCYTLKFSGLTQPVASHIHKGPAKKDGPIVLDLKPKFTTNMAKSCVTIKPALATAIFKSPSAYYVNVHTQKYAAGAIRGQLSAG